MSDSRGVVATTKGEYGIVAAAANVGQLWIPVRGEDELVNAEICVIAAVVASYLQSVRR